MSDDQIFNNNGDSPAGGTILGPSPLGNLKPNESFTGSFSASGNNPQSWNYLTLKVDWGEQVGEINEANNTFATAITPGTITLTITPTSTSTHTPTSTATATSTPTATPTNTPVTQLPDLIITNLEITGITNDSISYEYTIKNIGSAPANLDGPTNANFDNVDVQAFLSNDQVFNNSGDSPAGGTILGSSPLGNLDPNESITGSFSASGDNPPQWSYLTLMIDWGEHINESNEANNTFATPIPTQFRLRNSWNPHCLVNANNSTALDNAATMGDCDDSNSIWRWDGSRIRNERNPYCLASIGVSQEVDNFVGMGTCGTSNSVWEWEGNRLKNGWNPYCLASVGVSQEAGNFVGMGTCGTSNSVWIIEVVP